MDQSWLSRCHVRLRHLDHVFPVEHFISHGLHHLHSTDRELSLNHCVILHAGHAIQGGQGGQGTMHSQCLKGLRKLKSGHRMIFTICESDSWHLAITILVAFVMSLCSN